MIDERNIYKKSNIYLAYLRVKNNLQNEELIFDQEIAFFENELENNLAEIKKCLKKGKYEFQKFDFLLKFKKIENDTTIADNIKFRPLVRFRFFDLVIMQSVFNVVAQSLKNFLPKENFGVQLDWDRSPYFYKGWLDQYKKFVNREKENLSENTVYQYTYEYDIAQFYPSIQQKNLFNQLCECLKLEEGNLVYIWLKNIIYFFNETNISPETKEIYEKFKEKNEDIYGDDLGLPQGPLYSPFLASFYTRNLFDEIKENVKINWDIDCEIIAYVDDGRIYFKDNVSNSCKEHGKKDIEAIVNDTLKKLNKEDINKKCVRLNNDKSFLVAIDEKSVASKLNYLTTESSLINNSINPNFDIEEETVDAVMQKHENIKNAIADMLKQLNDKSNPVDEQKKKNEINKLTKTYSTYAKRYASFLSRKISTSENYLELVELIFSPFNFSKKIISDKEESDKEELDTNICDLNYYYVLCNMLKSANNDVYKINYLCKTVKEMLMSYEKLVINDSNNGIFMFYYYLTTIKAIHTVDYVEYFDDLINFCCKNLKDNTLLQKAVYSYNLESWYLYYKLEEKEIDRIFDYQLDDPEIKAFNYCLKNPFCMNSDIEHYFFKNYLINFNSEKENTDDSINLVEKYDTLNNSTYNYEIYVHDKFELKKGVTEYKKLDSNSISAYKKIKILHNLIKYWKNEKYYNKYINPAYLILDNIYIDDNANDKDRCIHIINNISNFYVDYEVFKFSIPYKKYFFDFFMKLFNCEDNIIVNKKGRALKFWEYRILAYLHNKGFNLVDFLEMVDKLLERYDYFNHDVDINFERIRLIVDNRLKTVSDKDAIIQLHYFVQCIWKNGSRDLTYYTLHNQEHSVELIQNYMNLNKQMLSKLSLNTDETFILFAACYLHDIGMLKGLTKEEKFDINNKKIIDYYNDIMKKSTVSGAVKIENILTKFYEINDLTNVLIEDIVRGEHAIRSSIEIQNDHNLPLSDLEKKYVAEVSYNHMKNTDEIYGLQNKQLFRKKNIDIRKISMWLRLLDLTDITKYRVTQEVFDRYFDRMSVVSRFHWIKHLCIDDLNISIKQEKKDKGTSLGCLRVTLQVLMNYIPLNEKIEKPCEKSKDIHKNVIECCKFEEHDGRYKRDKQGFKVKYCDLRCAFFNEFKYFDLELEAINNYAKLYNEEIEFNIEYVTNNETLRDDFLVLTNYKKEKISATECIKDYFKKCK